MGLGYLILALVALSFFHFIVEGIIVPSKQMSIRMELHRKAEELDELAHLHGQNFAKDLYKMMKGSVHNLISNMPRYNLTTLTKVLVDSKSNQASIEAARKRIELLDSCQIPEVQAHRKRIYRLIDLTLFWSGVGWMVYVLPIAVIVTMYQELHRAAKTLLSLSPGSVESLDEGSIPA